MGILKKIGKELKRQAKKGWNIVDDAFISGPYNWMKDHPKEMAAYAAIVGGTAGIGYGLAGAGAAGAAGAGATGGTTGAVAAGTTAAQVAQASASNSMWPWLAASMGTNAVNAYMQNQANKQALEWQQYVTNNSHRIEVADLMGAGLNPAASANQGASGGSYNPIAPQLNNPLITAMQIKQMEEQTKQIMQETAIRQPEVVKALQDVNFLKNNDYSDIRNTPNAQPGQAGTKLWELIKKTPEKLTSAMKQQQAEERERQIKLDAERKYWAYYRSLTEEEKAKERQKWKNYRPF